VNRQVYFRPEAAAEAAAARKWYDSRQAGLGLKFANALRETISRIADSPLVFPSVRGETRRAVLRPFPYALYFRISDEAIVILAVHGRQDPRRWQERT
jgi:plasmid stabilization system protein ParE